MLYISKCPELRCWIKIPRISLTKRSPNQRFECLNKCILFDMVIFTSIVAISTIVQNDKTKHISVWFPLYHSLTFHSNIVLNALNAQFIHYKLNMPIEAFQFWRERNLREVMHCVCSIAFYSAYIRSIACIWLAQVL